MIWLHMYLTGVVVVLLALMALFAWARREGRHADISVMKDGEEAPRWALALAVFLIVFGWPVSLPFMAAKAKFQ
jgi:nicotinamide riboside transporter PnuC